ncbi:hypothetical protein BDV96DRAFT_656878, partial [Lophiotrema nucula]
RITRFNSTQSTLTDYRKPGNLSARSVRVYLRTRTPTIKRGKYNKRHKMTAMANPIKIYEYYETGPNYPVRLDVVCVSEDGDCCFRFRVRSFTLRQYSYFQKALDELPRGWPPRTIRVSCYPPYLYLIMKHVVTGSIDENDVLKVARYFQHDTRIVAEQPFNPSPDGFYDEALHACLKSHRAAWALGLFAFCSAVGEIYVALAGKCSTQLLLLHLDEHYKEYAREPLHYMNPQYPSARYIVAAVKNNVDLLDRDNFAKLSEHRLFVRDFKYESIRQWALGVKPEGANEGE